MATKKLMTAKSLREDLCKVYTELRTGKITPDEAKQIANVSGKIMKSAALQIEYNIVTKNTSKKIIFLED